MNRKSLIVMCSILLGLVFFAAADENLPGKQKQGIGITILYDNYIFAKELKTDWGFSCLLTGMEKTILFDTGAKGELLLENMEKLKVNPEDVDVVVISHDHGDHTGGLLAFLRKNSNVSVYLPPSCKEPFVRKVKATGARVIIEDGPVEICKGVYLTGPMGERIIEQSMIVETAEGTVVVTGCAHPGINEIVRKSKAILPKDIRLVFGGFLLLQKSEVELRQIISGFRELGVKKTGPTHCTGDQAIKMFKQAYGPDFVRIGVGYTFKIETLAN